MLSLGFKQKEKKVHEYRINSIKDNLSLLASKLEKLDLLYDEKEQEHQLNRTDYNDYLNNLSIIKALYGHFTLFINISGKEFYCVIEEILNISNWLMAYFLVCNINNLKTKKEEELNLSQTTFIKIFIDRDPTYFHLILKYVIENDIFTELNTLSLYDKINFIEEAEFYGLDDLVEIIKVSFKPPSQIVFFKSLSNIQKAFYTNGRYYNRLNDLNKDYKNSTEGIGICKNSYFTINFDKKYTVRMIEFKGLSLIPSVEVGGSNTTNLPYYYFNQDSGIVFNIDYSYRELGYSKVFDIEMEVSQITFKSFNYPFGISTLRLQ